MSEMMNDLINAVNSPIVAFTYPAYNLSVRSGPKKSVLVEKELIKLKFQKSLYPHIEFHF